MCTSHTEKTCRGRNVPFNYSWVHKNEVRERQIPYDITYMWNLKYDKNELIYNTETDSQT